jgi:hypothetical protein
MAFLALAAVAGCDSQYYVAAGPSSLSSGFTAASTKFDFQPATLRPETIPGNSCMNDPAFATRIIVVIGPAGDVILSGLRFSFTDRFGRNALPRVRPIPGSSPLSVPVSSIPPFSPIPVPGVAPLPPSPIPIPGSGGVNGFMVPAGGSRQLPFLLLFDCGVAPAGILFVMTDIADSNGRMHTSRFEVRVES